MRRFAASLLSISSHRCRSQMRATRPVQKTATWIEMDQSKAHAKPRQARGRLKIGDDWNAITIIALSQSSPLKAIAELVENSIDAKARTIVITRGREHGQHFLAIRDDGEGVP